MNTDAHFLLHKYFPPGCHIDTDGDTDSNAVLRARDIPPLRKPRRAVGRPTEERDDAARWLQQTLAAGPRPSAEIEEEATAHGVYLRTLRRAFRTLGGEATRVGGSHGQWHWCLPAKDGHNPPLNSGHL